MIRALSMGLLLTGAALAGGSGGPMPGMDHAAPAMPGMATASDMQAMGARMTADLRPLSGRAFDVRFAQLMADHHQMAIDMARVELAQGTDVRVRAAAGKVIAAQQEELARMQGWLRAWTGQTYTPRGAGKLMEITGRADRWFLTAMIPHHRGAVDMAALVPTRTQDAQVRVLAADIVRAQTAEIAQYTGWLKDLP